MTDAKILRGWGQIELFTGETRPTLLKKKYPVRKDFEGGSVWADSEELQEHRLKISENICKNVEISGSEADAQL